jgi:hypothetical protein
MSDATHHYVQGINFDRLKYQWTVTEVSHAPAEAWKDLEARKAAITALIAERDALRDAHRVLAEFAKTAPGRLPERVQAALLLSAEKGE